jgi:hypothetical protein
MKQMRMLEWPTRMLGVERLAKDWMVEAVGVEPTSGKRVSEASTCVAFYLNLAVRASEEGAWRVGQPCCISGLGARQTAPLDPL